MQSPSVASVAANIEAVGAPAFLKAPDLLLRVSVLRVEGTVEHCTILSNKAFPPCTSASPG